jgi:hypothetical protein
MKRAYLICLLQSLTATLLFSQSNPAALVNPSERLVPAIGAPQAGPKAQATILDRYGKLPLSFEANQGQSDPQVKYLSRGTGYSLFLTSNEAVLALQLSAPSPAGSGQAKNVHRPPVSHRPSVGAVLRMKLLNTNPKTEVSGQDELPGKSNYFIGNDPKKWHTNVRQFAKVRYENVYPGVDLVYYGNQQELEYDFVLQPGASPQAIRLGIAGAKRLHLEHGDLVLTSAGGDVHLRSPHIYQEANGVRHEVRGRYLIKSKNEVGFEVATYDRRRALVIDPVLAYSTYLGGSSRDGAYAIAVDSEGNAYVTGVTNSTDFPTTPGALQKTCCGAFVTKINPGGVGLVYSTYLGGTNIGYGIAIDTAGNAYVTGSTRSTDFPTVNAIQPTFGGVEDGFLTKINAAGSALVYSTYLGGSDFDWSQGVAVDTAGNAYVTGITASPDFPTANAIQPNHGAEKYWNAFVTKINASGNAFVYSTYLSGSSSDWGEGIAADTAGNAYVTGSASSTDFPTTANALQRTKHGGGDAFVTKFNANGSAFVYSTYLGGSWADFGVSIAVDSAGNAYVTGPTSSTDFPTANAIQPAFGGVWDAFVTKINASGTALVYSTYLGGSDSDMYVSDGGKGGIAIDTAGNAYVTGTTRSTDFPTVNAIQPAKRGLEDVFVTMVNSDGSALVYSTYLGGYSHDYAGGIAASGAGSAYLAGDTYSKNFPTTLGAYQQSKHVGTHNYYDAFVTRIAPQTFVLVSPSKLGYASQTLGTTSISKGITLINTGTNSLTINKIYLAGPNAGDFAETSFCPATLAPGAFCDISVTFTPTDKNTRKGLLVISDSDPASPQGAVLTGTGTFVSLSAKSLALGKVPVGTTSPPKTVTLTNVGSSQLNFAGIGITGTNAGDFSETNTCGTSIEPNASCTITVKFSPTATGTRKASVSIYDDGGGSPQKVGLGGTGT